MDDPKPKFDDIANRTHAHAHTYIIISIRNLVLNRKETSDANNKLDIDMALRQKNWEYPAIFKMNLLDP